MEPGDRRRLTNPWHAANLGYSLHVFSLPLGPVWALHTFYLVSCLIMLVLCVLDRRSRTRPALQTRSTTRVAPVRRRISSATAIASPDGASDLRSGRAMKR